MPLKASKFIWHDGRLVPWEQATVHVLSHALHYGSSVFEGIRVYNTPQGAVVFRLTDHMRRLFHPRRSIASSSPTRSRRSRRRAGRSCARTACSSGAYIRPIAFRGYGEMGVAGNIEQPANVSIAAWEWGSYLGEGGLEKGVDVCVSSWQRVAPNTVPALAKAGGNYLSSSLVTLEARRLGFAEGLALNTAGFVSEGAGENLFLVQDGKLYTPPVAASISPVSRAMPCSSSRSCRSRRRRARHSTRTAVHRRRGVLDRHGRRDHAGALGRQASRRRRPPRPDHGTVTEALFRLVRRVHRRPMGLARADAEPKTGRVDRPQAV